MLQKIEQFYAQNAPNAISNFKFSLGANHGGTPGPYPGGGGGGTGARPAPAARNFEKKTFFCSKKNNFRHNMHQMLSLISIFFGAYHVGWRPCPP